MILFEGPAALIAAFGSSYSWVFQQLIVGGVADGGGTGSSGGLVQSVGAAVSDVGAGVTQGVGQLGTNPDAIGTTLGSVGTATGDLGTGVSSLGRSVTALSASSPIEQVPLVAPVVGRVGGLVDDVGQKVTMLGDTLNTATTTGPVGQLATQLGGKVVPVVTMLESTTQRIGGTTGLGAPLNGVLQQTGKTLGGAGVKIADAGNGNPLTNTLGAAVPSNVGNVTGKQNWRPPTRKYATIWAWCTSIN
ncbi:MAG: putative lipoprotein [Pseudomonas sp.]|nr:putative lipoprotein [Pseudomonas sp.]